MENWAKERVNGFTRHALGPVEYKEKTVRKIITHTVELNLPNASAELIYDFMTNPSDERYSKWWPEEHLKFHIVKRGNERHVKDVVYMDEYIGKNHRLTFHAVVKTADRPQKAVWQMVKAGIKLPAFVELSLKSLPNGVLLIHKLSVGWDGLAGRLFDPFIRLYITDSFKNALETHCKYEWPRLCLFIKPDKNSTG